ncbi:allantoate permease [Moniliophthora roreri MCA 2997]|uniref:Allantoate permease n=1 Tax=Moniliophthora roreri (strain MCA 2997) TaxID=1381753 RepID=V2WR70_MONRO|nr:allantoate permease [Moniliophthora roreri MCA 2997]
MSSTDKKSLENLETKSSSIVDEKASYSPSSDLINLGAGDEALKLVSLERSAEFREQYNNDLRRKMCHGSPDQGTAIKLGFNVIRPWYDSYSSYSLTKGFLVFEFPTVYLAQRARIAKYLGSNVVIWGTVLAPHAVAPTFGSFFAL